MLLYVQCFASPAASIPALLPSYSSKECNVVVIHQSFIRFASAVSGEEIEYSGILRFEFQSRLFHIGSTYLSVLGPRLL